MWYDSANQTLLQEIPYMNSIFLLGTAEDGPVNRPVKINHPEQAKKIFSTIGSLYKGYMQGYSIAPELDYFLVRITGSYARGLYLDKLTFRSKGAGVKYNDIKISIEQLTYFTGNIEWALVVYPHEVLGEPVAYFLKDFPKLGLLIQAINADTDAGRGCIYTNTVHYGLSSLVLTDNGEEEILLSGGLDGLDASKNDLYRALDKTYQLLEGRGIRIIVPLGVYFDDMWDQYFYNLDTYGNAYYTREEDPLDITRTGGQIHSTNGMFMQIYNSLVFNEFYSQSEEHEDLIVTDGEGDQCTFHEQLIDFCRAQQRFGMITHGVLGLRPFSDWLIQNMHTLEYKHVPRLVTVTALGSRMGFYDHDSQRDKGFYISIFAGDFLFTYDNPYWDSGAVVYATMIAKHGLEGTSNKVIPGNPEYRPILQSTELKALSTLGVVGCRTSPIKGMVVHNGVTPGLYQGELHNLANVTMAQIAVFHINQILQEYKGEPIPPERVPIVVMNLKRDINETLAMLQDNQIILGYSFNVISTTSRQWSCELNLTGKQTIADINIPLEMIYGGSS